MDKLETPISMACKAVGSQAEMARKLNLSAPMVNQWVQGARPVPIEYCAAIEAATGNTVMRWDLRPEDWYRIWPELIGAEGAPATPVATEQGA